MNEQKTEGIWLGKNEPANAIRKTKWSNEPVKSLGIYFGTNEK